MSIKFNVFGKRMLVDRKNGDWLLFNDADTGIKSRVYDVVIPAELTEDALASYLDDIYHEYSSEKMPSVVKLS